MHNGEPGICCKEPFLLNCIKHHLRYIAMRIEFYASTEILDVRGLNEELGVIGNSQIDIYTGSMTVDEITSEIKKYLGKYFERREEYFKWLRSNPTDYALVDLSDGSNWTLLPGHLADRYIHLHPSRNSRNSVRFRASTLKTAIVFGIIKKRDDALDENTKIINKIRKEYLNLAPIKSLNSSPGIRTLINIILGFSESNVT